MTVQVLDFKINPIQLRKLLRQDVIYPKFHQRFGGRVHLNCTRKIKKQRCNQNTWMSAILWRCHKMATSHEVKLSDFHKMASVSDIVLRTMFVKKRNSTCWLDQIGFILFCFYYYNSSSISTTGLTERPKYLSTSHTSGCPHHFNRQYVFKFSHLVSIVLYIIKASAYFICYCGVSTNMIVNDLNKLSSNKFGCTER